MDSMFGDGGYGSSSLPGPSGERWYGRDGGDDGFGSLGLALRNLLAFVFELKRWVFHQHPFSYSSRSFVNSASLSCPASNRSLTHHLLHPTQRRRGLLPSLTVLTPIPRSLDDNMIHNYNVLPLPSRRQHPADRIEYLLRFLSDIPVDFTGSFVGTLQGGCCAGVEGRGGDAWWWCWS